MMDSRSGHDACSGELGARGAVRGCARCGLLMACSALLRAGGSVLAAITELGLMDIV